jgi:hypothetical protein
MDIESFLEVAIVSSLLQRCVGMWIPSGMQECLDKCMIDMWQSLRGKQVFFGLGWDIESPLYKWLNME